MGISAISRGFRTMIRKPIPTAWQILMNSRWSAMSHIQVSSWNSVLCRAMVQRTLGASLDEQRTIADEVLGDVGDLLEAVGHCDWIDWGKVQNWKDRMIQSSTEREKAEGVDWEEKRMIWTVFLLYGEIGELALLETGDSVLPLPGRWGALRRHPSCLPTSPPPAPTDWRLSHHQRPSFLVSPFVFDIAKLLCMGFDLVWTVSSRLVPSLARVNCVASLHLSLSPCVDGNRFRGYIQTGWRSCVPPGLHRFRGYSLLR